MVKFNESLFLTFWVAEKGAGGLLLSSKNTRCSLPNQAKSTKKKISYLVHEPPWSDWTCTRLWLWVSSRVIERKDPSGAKVTKFAAKKKWECIWEKWITAVCCLNFDLFFFIYLVIIWQLYEINFNTLSSVSCFGWDFYQIVKILLYGAYAKQEVRLKNKNKKVEPTLVF